jgi:hypothetical protein
MYKVAKMPFRKRLLSLPLAVFAISLATSACSPRSLATVPAAIGGTVGAVAGAVIGKKVGGDEYDPTQAAMLGGAVGSAAGLGVGAMVYESSVEKNKRAADKLVLRKPYYADDFQREIDALRRAEQNASKFGRSETKPWNERYIEERPPSEYQAAPMY